MSKAGKLVKDIVKAKKESVMGKLGDSPYEDPMEPWSAKYQQPVKEEVLNEDGLLMKYIRSLGFNPEFMTFAQRSSYARSNAFKRYKAGHTFDREKQNLKQEEQIDELNKDTLQKYKTAAHKSISANAVARHAGEISSKEYHATADKRSKGINRADADKRLGTYADKRPKLLDISMHGKEIQKQYHSEETEQLDEAGTGLLMSFIKSKGLNPLTMDGNQKKAYARSSEFRIFKMRHMKETSGMGERGDDWNEEKKTVKEEADAKDTVTMDIPLLIRVLEYAREDAKTDMDLHKVVENLINMRGEGTLSMEMYNKIVAIKEEIEKLDEISKDLANRYMWAAKSDRAGTDAEISKAVNKNSKEFSLRRNKKIGKLLDKSSKRTTGILKALDRLKKEDTGQIDELSSDMLGRYKKAAGAQASAADKAGDYAKGNKRFAGIIKATKKQFANDAKKVNELKKQDDNQELDSHLTREDLRKWFSKTDPEGDWKRINSKGEVAGPCAREPGEPKPKCMSKEKRAELSKSERAAAVATKRKHDPVADRAGKGGKPINVSNYGKGKLSEDEVDEACWDTHKQVGTKMKGGKIVPDCVPKNEEAEQMDEKNSPTNPSLWSRAKSLARSKFDVYPSAYANGWASKWYKSKGGGWKSVKEDVVQEGIGGIEDSPMSATNSVKAMESEQRKKNMKSARIIKSIYKKKGKNESMYDWEKDDKPAAKITIQGGTTMTGKPRDTVEIEPVLKTRPNNTK
jgi:hypothetical protein